MRSSLRPRLLDTARELAPIVSAGVKIAFFGHLLIYALTCALIYVVAGRMPALVTALGWGIGVASHGFFAVAAPALRRHWAPPTPKSVPQSPVQVATSVAQAAPERQRARSLEELSAAIAHEIRSPITAAKSLVQQIAEDPSAAETVEHAQVAVQELDRVERSISHLLRFAREEPFEPKELDLSELIRSAVELLRDRTDKQGVRVVMDLDLLPPLRADGEQLRKLIANLIGNALDAFAEHATVGPTLQIAAGSNLAGDQLWIRVRDNGPGMSPQVASKIFQPFYTTKGKSGGTGLGLALARKVVDRHGGSIEVESTSGEGTAFVITLPCRPRAGGATP